MSARIGVAAGMLLACAASLAADEVAPLPGLDECIKAALDQRPGVLYGWEAMAGVYRVTVLGNDEKVADATCSPESPGTLYFENRVGLRRLDRYQNMAVPESKARMTAPAIFSGKVKLTRMEIDTDVRGHPSYEYRMRLPSGHEAKARIDSGSGELTYAEVKE
jgi:hypothetical protein